MTTDARSKRWLVLAGLLCCALGAAYWLRGLAIYFSGTPLGGHDIRVHWIEQQYLIRHINPADVIFPPPSTPDGSESAPPPPVDPQVGRPSFAGSYPPWMYFTAAPILLLPLPWLYRVYAVLMVLSQVVICRLAWVHFRRWGCVQAYLAAAAATALSATAATVFLGQYGILVTALLFIMFRALRGASPLGPGLAYGVALLKPTVAGPFAFLLLRPWRPRALALASAFNLLGLFAVSFWLRQNPIALMRQFLQFGTRFLGMGYGPVQYLNQLGLPVGPTSIVIAFGTSGAALLALRRLPRRIGMAHMAVCAVAARFWGYHQHYDDVILVFLLLAVYEMFFERPTRGRLAVAAAVSASLMVPARVGQFTAWQIVQQCIWITGVSVVWTAARGVPSAKEGAPAWFRQAHG